MTASRPPWLTAIALSASSARAGWPVYLAKDLKHERLVALKVLRAELGRHSARAVGVANWLDQLRRRSAEERCVLYPGHTSAHSPNGVSAPVDAGPVAARAGGVRAGM